MQRTGPTKGKQGKETRIISFFKRNSTNSTLHAGVDDANNAESRLLESHFHLLRQFFHECIRTLRIELISSAKEVSGFDAAQNHVSIGHGEKVTFAVTGRARISTGRIGSYIERIALVQVNNRATTGTDSMNCHSGNANRTTGYHSLGRFCNSSGTECNIS